MYLHGSVSFIICHSVNYDSLLLFFIMKSNNENILQVVQSLFVQVGCAELTVYRGFSNIE